MDLFTVKKEENWDGETDFASETNSVVALSSKHGYFSNDFSKWLTMAKRCIVYQDVERQNAPTKRKGV